MPFSKYASESEASVSNHYFDMKPLISFNLTQERFLAEVLERDMWIVRGAVANNLVKWGDVNSALYYVDPTPPHMRVHLNGIVSEGSYLESFPVLGVEGKRVAKKPFNDLLRRGATVVLNRVDSRFEVVRQLCSEVSEFMRAETLANAYLAFSGTGTFGRHWDTHDVVAIQLIGKKRWKVYRPTFELPLPGQTSKKIGHLPAGAAVFDDVLNAGDLIYLPRGWWHEAIPDGQTFHVAIGVHTATVSHYLAWLTNNVLKDKLEFRRSVRPDIRVLSDVETAARSVAIAMLEPEHLAAYVEMLRSTATAAHQPFLVEQSADAAVMADDRHLV